MRWRFRELQLVVLNCLLEATTKNGRQLFLRKKVHPRQNPDYAYATEYRLISEPRIKNDWYSCQCNDGDWQRCCEARHRGTTCQNSCVCECSVSYRRSAHGQYTRSSATGEKTRLQHCSIVRCKEHFDMPNRLKACASIIMVINWIWRCRPA